MCKGWLTSSDATFELVNNLVPVLGFPHGDNTLNDVVCTLSEQSSQRMTHLLPNWSSVSGITHSCISSNKDLFILSSRFSNVFCKTRQPYGCLASSSTCPMKESGIDWGGPMLIIRYTKSVRVQLVMNNDLPAQRDWHC